MSHGLFVVLAISFPLSVAAAMGGVVRKDLPAEAEAWQVPDTGVVRKDLGMPSDAIADSVEANANVLTRKEERSTSPLNPPNGPMVARRQSSKIPPAGDTIADSKEVVRFEVKPEGALASEPTRGQSPENPSAAAYAEVGSGQKAQAKAKQPAQVKGPGQKPPAQPQQQQGVNPAFANGIGQVFGTGLSSPVEPVGTGVFTRLFDVTNGQSGICADVNGFADQFAIQQLNTTLWQCKLDCEFGFNNVGNAFGAGFGNFGLNALGGQFIPGIGGFGQQQCTAIEFNPADLLCKIHTIPVTFVNPDPNLQTECLTFFNNQAFSNVGFNNFAGGIGNIGGIGGGIGGFANFGAFNTFGNIGRA